MWASSEQPEGGNPVPSLKHLEICIYLQHEEENDDENDDDDDDDDEHDEEIQK